MNNITLNKKDCNYGTQRKQLFKNIFKKCNYLLDMTDSYKEIKQIRKLQEHLLNIMKYTDYISQLGKGYYATDRSISDKVHFSRLNSTVTRLIDLDTKLPLEEIIKQTEELGGKKYSSGF